MRSSIAACARNWRDAGSLSDRESALAEARLALEELREVAAPETKIVLKPDRMEASWSGATAVNRREPQDEDESLRVTSFAISCWSALAAAAIVFYPRFESSYPGIQSYLPEIGTILRQSPTPPACRRQSLRACRQLRSL